MSVVIKVVYNNLPRIPAAARVSTRAVVKKYADAIQNDIKFQILQPKRGRMYWGKSGRWYRASAPGEAPAIDTAKYYRGIGNRWIGALTRMVYTNDPRAGGQLGPWLEEGTPGGRMAARPHFGPAADKFRLPFLTEMRSHLRGIGKL